MNEQMTTPTHFDFSNLLPDWDALQRLLGSLLDWNIGGFTAQLSEPKSLSALLVVFLGVVFAWFLLKGVIWGCFRANRRIAFFHRLLRGVTPENLNEKRSDLRERTSRKGRLGSVWTEFDETLVVSGNRVQNSFDAAYFFNTHSLARGITESRLLAAVPGFLTAIGVIGTFMGLQLGLSGLNLSDTQHAQTGINQLVSGASVAFMTSVWGVGLSVLFNLIEKAVEQRVRNRIIRLQYRIDTLFPRTNPEQTLLSIHDENRKATITLDGLAEKIGNQMQQAISDATGQMLEGVVKGLQEAMEPAIKKLVESSNSVNRHQEQGSQEALKALIKRFGDAFYNQGKEQQAALKNAAGELGDKLSGWSDTMSTFLNRLESQQQAAEQSNQTLVEVTRGYIDKIQQAGDKQRSNMQEQMNASVGQVIQQFGTAQQEWIAARETEQQRLNEEVEAVARRISHAGELVSSQGASQVTALQEQSKGLMEQLQDFSKRMSESVAQHVQSSAVLLRQSEMLNGQVREIGMALEKSSGAFKDGASHLDRSSTGLGQLADKLHNASDDLGGRLATLTDDVDRLTAEHIKANTGLVQMQQHLVALGDRLERAGTAVSEATHGAVEQTEDLRQHQRDLQQAMQEQIEKLQEQIGMFLTEYGQRVQGQTTERLNEWNNQTREFSSTMVDATKAIAELVDELESKFTPAA